MREAGAAGYAGDHLLKPDAREDRDAVPLHFAVDGALVFAAGELRAKERLEGVVGELRLL